MYKMNLIQSHFACKNACGVGSVKGPGLTTVRDLLKGSEPVKGPGLITVSSSI